MTNDVETILEQGVATRLHPRGTSMWPTLREGDVVELEPAFSRGVQARDIVLYRREGGPLVLHRVVKADDDSVWLRGDNQFEIEGPLPVSCLRGILTTRERRGRRIAASSLRWQLWGLAWTLALPLRRLIRKLKRRT